MELEHSGKNPCFFESLRGLSLALFPLMGLIFAGMVQASAEFSEISGTVLINGVPSAGTVVYLEKIPKTLHPSPGKTITITQQGKQFKPTFAVITVGDTIRFENHDDEIHNIQSRSPENRFDTGAHMPGTVKEITLNHSGAVLLRCRTHENMKATVFVSPSEFFTLSDSSGRYVISRIPAGDYRLKAWHPRLTPREQEKGALGLIVTKGKRTIRLELSARAPEGRDLTAYTGKVWADIIGEMDKELIKTISLWKKGKRTAAARRIMSAQSRLYGESGFKSAIGDFFGENRAVEYENRLDSIRKQVQGVGSKKPTLGGLQQETEQLIRDLRKDAGEISR